jgi:hypothetical protein
VSSGPYLKGTGASLEAWLVWLACLVSWVPLKMLGYLASMPWWAILGVLFLWLGALVPERYDNKAD